MLLEDRDPGQHGTSPGSSAISTALTCRQAELEDSLGRGEGPCPAPQGPTEPHLAVTMAMPSPQHGRGHRPGKAPTCPSAHSGCRAMRPEAPWPYPHLHQTGRGSEGTLTEAEAHCRLWPLLTEPVLTDGEAEPLAPPWSSPLRAAGWLVSGKGDSGTVPRASAAEDHRLPSLFKGERKHF